MDEAQHARLCALVQKLNHFFVHDQQNGRGMGGSLTWVTSLFTGKLHPRHEAIELFMIENEVTEKEADSLTSEWRKLGVDCALEPLMDSSRWGWHRRQLF